MSPQEKRAWIMVVVSAAAYTTYVVIVLGRARGTSLVDVPYAGTLVWTVIASIVVSIVLNILVGISTPRGEDKKDQRDREIGRFGEYVGQSFLVIGGVSALFMALAEFDYFWIANVIYLAFVLSSLLGSTARIIAYRRGLPTW
jgi:hypothetical protein